MAKKRRRWFNFYEPTEQELAAIPLKKRKRFLIKCLYRNKFIESRIVRKHREEFRVMRDVLCPLEGRICYACPNLATDRHHVIPLCKGGRNVPSNLVPLCVDCHRTMNVLNADPEFKRRYCRATQQEEINPYLKMNKVYTTGSLSSASVVLFHRPV